MYQQQTPNRCRWLRAAAILYHVQQLQFHQGHRTVSVPANISPQEPCAIRHTPSHGAPLTAIRDATVPGAMSFTWTKLWKWSIWFWNLFLKLQVSFRIFCRLKLISSIFKQSLENERHHHLASAPTEMRSLHLADYWGPRLSLYLADLLVQSLSLDFSTNFTSRDARRRAATAVRCAQTFNWISCEHSEKKVEFMVL